MDAVVCPNCGAENRPEARFCANCRYDLASRTLTEQAEPAPTRRPRGDLLSALVEVGGSIAGGARGKRTGSRPTIKIEPRLKERSPQPERLTNGQLYPSTIYRRTEPVGRHADYFVAEDGQAHFLIREVEGFSCERGEIHGLVKLSAELPSVQNLIDVVCAEDGRTYMVLTHPDARWYLLSDQLDPIPPEQAIEWGIQIGQALAGLHQYGYTLGEKRQGGLDKILIAGTAARLADLSTCVPLATSESQRRQAVLDDTLFLARALYAMVSGKDLTTDSQWSQELEHLPRSLRSAISAGVRGSYIKMQEMLANLAGRNLPPLRLSSGKATHPGRVHEHNEDQYFAYEVSKGRSDQPLPAFYMVADGMGGHQAGEVASDTISIALKEWLDEFSARKSGRATRKLGELPDEALRRAIQDANAAVFRQAQARQNDMGATVTAALIVGETAHVANVGDSRTYLFRRGKLEQITKDHSLVYSLAASGQIDWDEIYTHPQRNQIYRSLGTEAKVTVDVFSIDLQPGDSLLLCSDGLWEMVRDPQIVSILQQARNPQDACDQLIDAANRGGGKDNIAAIIVRAD
ncbi:MAG: Stp1/IreP family PP2C-type Ser/Thr phosphatase [Chloroflexi bacterium]|nr:Stp1/IreP family PP2C-type Ser/Thr phosphatase [Chloroflexota bacterium]MBL7198549.1 Stp1/IreP family PP2C-type Ser/Thr phosphatase [Anaerolineae bacterium]